MRRLILSLLLSASAIISMQARSLVVALTDGREFFYLLGNETPTKNGLVSQRSRHKQKRDLMMN